jgi:DNA uptake protein ComE-like DNA-binding protein
MAAISNVGHAMTFRTNLLAALLTGALAAMPLPVFAQAAKPPATAPAPAGKPADPLDINTATKAQLMTLKGIGEARSDAIIKGRPYRAKNELVDKKIIPKSVYDGIKDQIVAKQASAPATTPKTSAPATTPKK